MKYSIVIPTYNHCDDLLKPCINSILQYTNLQDIELIISANGCTDNTQQYLEQLSKKFNESNLSDHLKLVWCDLPLGYSKSINAGIKVATCDKIILLNNDIILLPQIQNEWINILNNQFLIDPYCGISGPSKIYNDVTNRDFLIFFCVMIDRKVFSTIGLLNEEYGKGGYEDVEFCILAENIGFHVNRCIKEQVWNTELNMFTSTFPIYHKGEGTVHDKTLVPDWDDVFLTNAIKISKKFNQQWYRWYLSSNLERAVYLRGNDVDLREKARYIWASKHIYGNKVLDLGCSTGYGAQFLDDAIHYTGIDYNAKIIEEAKKQNWLPNATFIHANLMDYTFDNYDTIIAFEVIEHLENGLLFVEKLKQHCTRLLITVPYNENVDSLNPHHLLHNLSFDQFHDFELIGYIDHRGDIISHEQLSSDEEYAMLIEWNKKNPLFFLKDKDPSLYAEVIETNVYEITKELIEGKNVLDIGANIGIFSLLANYYGAKKIISFEPVTSTFSQFLNNILCVNSSVITPIKSAVTSKSGEIVSIMFNTNSGANNIYKKETDNGLNAYELISTISFTDALKLFDDDDIFLKLDCEGAEFDIILNATNELMNRISRIAIEIHSDIHPLYRDQTLIENKLINFGFRKIANKQMMGWNKNEMGEIINYRELPIITQVWTR